LRQRIHPHPLVPFAFFDSACWCLGGFDSPQRYTGSLRSAVSCRVLVSLSNILRLISHLTHYQLTKVEERDWCRNFVSRMRWSSFKLSNACTLSTCTAKISNFFSCCYANDLQPVLPRDTNNTVDAVTIFRGCQRHSWFTILLLSQSRQRHKIDKNLVLSPLPTTELLPFACCSLNQKSSEQFSNLSALTHTTHTRLAGYSAALGLHTVVERFAEQKI